MRPPAMNTLLQDSLAMKKIALALAVATLPFAAHAHKQWLAPSKTVINVGQWITVDAAVSTDPFTRDHNPARIETLVITAPDGSTVQPENASTGKLRSTFDVQLSQAGTYKVALVNQGISARWEDNGQRKSWPPRGQPFTAEGFAKEVPANADKLTVTESTSQVVTYATAGKPNDTALKPSGKGLELVPVGSITDLYVGEEAKFAFVLDGKPAPGVDVEIIADGVRYRTSVDAIELKTDKDGGFAVNWKAPGLYWISASVSDDKASAPAKTRRTSYTATVEVLTP